MHSQKGRHDDRQEGVTPVQEVIEEQIQRDHGDLIRKHHGRQNDHEEHIAAGKFEPRKGVRNRSIR